MKLPKRWRAPIAGLALFSWPAWAGAQGTESLTLEEALRRSGALGVEQAEMANPRVVAPQQDVAAAEALVGQAGLRPNPEVSLEVENVAGTGAFSGLQATEYT